ncbi:hypothetical protein LEP1GSC018_1272 [Leptospira kirschneri str. 2008720114]|nr:hypothetical protein LEP1GSC018_1272 [Leptospira kirschneri str. 2008720114]
MQLDHLDKQIALWKVDIGSIEKEIQILFYQLSKSNLRIYIVKRNESSNFRMQNDKKTEI